MVEDNGSPVGVWEWGQRWGDWRVSDFFSLGFFFIYCSAKRRRFALIIYKKKKTKRRHFMIGSFGARLGSGSLRNKPNFRLKLGLLGLRAKLEPSFSSRAQARARAQGLNYQPYSTYYSSSILAHILLIYDPWVLILTFYQFNLNSFIIFGFYHFFVL